MKLDWNEIIEEVKTGMRHATVLEIIVNWAIVFSVGFLLAICLVM